MTEKVFRGLLSLIVGALSGGVVNAIVGRYAALDLKIPANQLMEEAIDDYLRKHSEKQ